MPFLAVTPDEAAESLTKWVEELDISKTGEYWAPRGPGACMGRLAILYNRDVTDLFQVTSARLRLFLDRACPHP